MTVQPAPAPRAAEDTGVFPLRLAAAVHRTFPEGPARIDDDFSARHFADLTTLYGVEHRPEVAARGTGNTFAVMAAALLADLSAGPVDAELVVVAHTTPDLDCRLAAVTALSVLVPGDPQVLTVADCGTAAPFVALELAGRYVRRHGYRSAAVFVLDQATLPYETGRDLAGDAGVALLFSADGAAGQLAVHRASGVGTDDVPGLAPALLDGLGCDPDVPLVLGPGLDADTGPAGHTGRRLRAPAGLPASATLTELVAEARRAPHEDRIALLDHDPETGELSACLLRRDT
ncbi:hypothetical protein L1085_008135 [Streptomyces sp. MSC1_001]|jgi:hypothetical protein|uniref:hypothetical protein n=1 Tax=Streptomyces sp. MSC1_001 TaxID=2909263 RepID=UPI00203072DF|nr:hypothetical protein [Streptomyces sp. MSC1_001]